ncbi:hypothetical protein GYB59_15795 [bacterium]|nr:hypothetical protein [bacterium]
MIPSLRFLPDFHSAPERVPSDVSRPVSIQTPSPHRLLMTWAMRLRF